MELAIPLVALGGLYVISNHKKKQGFTSVNEYNKPNQTTDKYFSPDKKYKEESKTSTFTDLAGRQVGVNDYSENMVPFFGKTKNIGNSLKDYNQSENFMDTYTGSGSLQINKTEVAPLFKPNEHVQWANGAPNQSEFYQSRVNPSQNMHNVKPFQEIRVAPGLNKGFSSQGSGGFNSGTESREKWTDKTVDELRVATNPKQTFDLIGHQGPAQTLVKNVGIEGKVEKHLPDKFYINSPDRYLTTTGLQVASTARSVQPNPTIHRATTTQEYAGAPSSGVVQSQPKHGMYRSDHRQQFHSEGFTPAVGQVEQNNLTAFTDSYKLLPTNREVIKSETFGGMYGLINALTAPITDMVRPTRKEDLVGLTRKGNAGSTVANAPITEMTVAPTVKQTTMYSPYSMGQRAYAPITDGGYKVTEQQPIQNQRDTTSISYMGIGGSVMPQPISTEADRNINISANRMTNGRTAIGNIKTFQPFINQTTNNNRSDMHTSYVGSAGSSITNVPPSMEQYGGIRNANIYAEPDRMAPDLLNAFKKNPYTHSLHSVA